MHDMAMRQFVRLIFCTISSQNLGIQAPVGTQEWRSTSIPDRLGGSPANAKTSP
jgi:hypothetical protein